MVKRQRTEALLDELESFRRRLPHVSHSALSAILDEVQRSGVPEMHSRRHVRNARELIFDRATPYGHLHQDRLVAAADGGPPVHMQFAHPLALIWKAYSHCKAFADYVDKCLEMVPSTQEHPWRLVFYSDEVIPGDQIGGKKHRKFQTVYFSFMEFQDALSHEDCWFTAVTYRSSQVALMAGGMAAVFGTLIKTCFVDNYLSVVGLVLNRDGRPPTRVFARLGCFVQDGAAHKSTWHCKGEAGSKICILCRNLFSARSELCDEDGGELLH